MQGTLFLGLKTIPAGKIGNFSYMGFRSQDSTTLQNMAPFTAQIVQKISLGEIFTAVLSFLRTIDLTKSMFKRFREIRSMAALD